MLRRLRETINNKTFRSIDFKFAFLKEKSGPTI